MVLAVPLIATWEGKSNDPYLDIVKVKTVCYGETRVLMRRYSDAECSAMLETAVQGFAEPVARCTPAIANRPYQLAAATSLAYNVGARGYCGSTAARRFNAGDFKGGCAALKFWNKAGGRVVAGLVNRRAAEYRLCMVDL
ncbi:lysozyme [Sphingomonadales bacterium 56]|nr:lysozyme [Sphingomonadales bacterium 56]MBY2957479.1 lysozyme [Sphingomonadales bacterium 58]MBY2957522.1 lysozyme [Sphingomonadales bacterium 58]